MEALAQSPFSPIMLSMNVVARALLLMASLGFSILACSSGDEETDETKAGDGDGDGDGDDDGTGGVANPSGECGPGFADLDGDTTNGCESVVPILQSSNSDDDCPELPPSGGDECPEKFMTCRYSLSGSDCIDLWYCTQSTADMPFWEQRRWDCTNGT